MNFLCCGGWSLKCNTLSSTPLPIHQFRFLEAGCGVSSTQSRTDGFCSTTRRLSTWTNTFSLGMRTRGGLRRGFWYLRVVYYIVTTNSPNNPEGRTVPEILNTVLDSSHFLPVHSQNLIPRLQFALCWTEWSSTNSTHNSSRNWVGRRINWFNYRDVALPIAMKENKGIRNDFKGSWLCNPILQMICCNWELTASKWNLNWLLVLRSLHKPRLELRKYSLSLRGMRQSSQIRLYINDIQMSQFHKQVISSG